MSWAPAAASLGSLALGAYQQFGQPDAPVMPGAVAPNYATPGTYTWTDTGAIDPRTGKGSGSGLTRTINTYTPEEYRQNALYDLYRGRLMGGETLETWKSTATERMRELAGQIGFYGEPTDLEAWDRDYLGQYGDWIKSMYDKHPEWQEYMEEYSALKGMIANQSDIPFSQIGTSTKERQVQIGEQTGSYQDLLQKASEESYTSALADLARRGITGGTAESDLIQRKAEGEASIADQSVIFAENLRQYDDTVKRELLNMIAGGTAAEGAQRFQESSLAQQGAYGQNQLAFARQQLAMQEAQRRQTAMQNMMAMLGQAGGSMNQNNMAQNILSLLMRQGSGMFDPYGNYTTEQNWGLNSVPNY